MRFRIPGTTEPEITVRRSALGSLTVLVNGRQAKRKRARGMTYDIPLSDGSTAELELKGQWTGVKAVVNGVETALEPGIPGYVIALSLLPLLLVLIGGLIGGVIGVVGAAINARLARESMRLPLKVGAILVVSALSLAVAVGAAVAFTFAISPIPTLQAATCVNGIREGATVTEETTHPVDCGAPHDNEVVGTILYTGSGDYPGQDALQSFAEQPCIDAFRTYVGVDFQSSSLNMIVVSPSNITWAKGDRQIGCVVLASNGGQLTGTVKGSGQ